MRISDWSSDVCSSDLYLSVAAKANGVFMTRFRRMTGDLTPIDSVDAQERAIMAKAPLYRISETGMDELGHRRQTLDGGDRKSGVTGQRVSVRVVFGGLRILKQTENKMTRRLHI